MKKVLKNLLIAILILTMAISLFACNKNPSGASLWDSAIYSESATVGEGKLTFALIIECESKSITLTVKTDKEVLGDALYELELINDPAFFDVANGIKADWDKDKAYWSYYIGNDFAMHGIDAEKLTDGAVYKLVYTK